MMYLMFLLSLTLVVAVGGVAINPLPQYGAGFLVLATGSGCAVLACSGGTFVSIVLLLIYLGGMLVVFAYSVALVSGGYGVQGGLTVNVRSFVIVMCVLYVVSLWVGFFYEVKGDWFGSEFSTGEFGWSAFESNISQLDLCGVPFIYCSGEIALFFCVFCLFVCLFVVLGLTRGAGSASLRLF